MFLLMSGLSNVEVIRFHLDNTLERKANSVQTSYALFAELSPTKWI